MTHPHFGTSKKLANRNGLLAGRRSTTVAGMMLRGDVFGFCCRSRRRFVFCVPTFYFFCSSRGLFAPYSTFALPHCICIAIPHNFPIRFRPTDTMAPIPESQVPEPFDSDDEESLLLLASLEKKCYSSVVNNDEEKPLRDESQGSFLLRVWSSYFSLLQRWPLTVKSITALILMMLADFFAQSVEFIRGIHHESFVDVLRMLRFGVFGLLGAPWTHYYYDWLDRTLPPTEQPWTFTTAVKVLIDQGIQAPIVLALIIGGLAFMEGRGKDGIHDDIGNAYVYSLIQNWKLWIPATIINIAFVKPALRVLYDNVIFLVWTIYLSMILNGDRAAT